SNTPDPTVTSQPVTDGSLKATGSVAANRRFATDLRVETADTRDMRNGQLIIRLNRILHPGDGAAAAGEAGQPCLSATWRLADGPRVRGISATAQHLQQPGAESKSPPGFSLRRSRARERNVTDRCLLPTHSRLTRKMEPQLGARQRRRCRLIWPAGAVG